ncbi:MAG: polymer-forming cytoskeletal protein [Spirochaetota bacterium]|nr:polymer-forming cytoskeletal protein [Spirochaetota bacterium]
MPSKNDPVDSVIGEGSAFEGQFHVRGSLRVEGRFVGQVEIENELIVGEQGKVQTNVRARRVIIAGTFIGNIEALEEVVLMSTGKVMGNIKTPTLTVQKGVITSGKVEITAGDASSSEIQTLIEESFNSGPGFPRLMNQDEELQANA